MITGSDRRGLTASAGRHDVPVTAVSVVLGGVARVVFRVVGVRGVRGPVGAEESRTVRVAPCG
jgi:hypothetical protein